MFIKIMNNNLYPPTRNRMSLYYEVKLVTYSKGVPDDFMLGSLIADAQSANVSIRQFLWMALKYRNDYTINANDTPTTRNYKHWCQVLYDCKPKYYKHFFICYAPHQKEAAEIVFRCLKWLQENDEEYYMSITAAA